MKTQPRPPPPASSVSAREDVNDGKNDGVKNLLDRGGVFSKANLVWLCHGLYPSCVYS